MWLGGACGEVNRADVPVDFRASPMTTWHLVGLWTPMLGAHMCPWQMLGVRGGSCGGSKADGCTCILPRLPGQM